MIARLAWHELRQQLGGRVFWFVFAVSVLMVAGAMAIDELRVGVTAPGARTGAAAIAQTHLLWTLFFLFTAAALVGEAVLRDRTSGFAELVGATPVDRRAYALGRFAGALGALVLCFASVPAAMAVGGTIMGIGAGEGKAYAFAFVVLALPNLVLAAALFFALASTTRSMTGCLLGAAALLTLYGLAREGGGSSPALAEPFGFAALAAATRGWSVVQRDASLPAIGGVLLWNRLLWLAVAAALVGLGTWFSGRDASRDGRRRLRAGGSAASALAAAGESFAATLPPMLTAPAPQGWRVPARQILVRTGFEAGRILRSPVFAVLLLMGLASAAAAVWQVAGTPATIAALATSFQLVPVVVALFFGGELFWAEREHAMAPIIAATPARKVVVVLPKLVALAMVLLALAGAAGVAGMAVELVKGGSTRPEAYLAWYILPKAYEWLLVGVLALFLQSLAPGKLAGWGYMVFYLIGSLALGKLGWTDPHYRYGSYPGAPLPPALSGARGVGWYRLGWGAAAAGLAALACSGWPWRVKAR